MKEIARVRNRGGRCYELALRVMMDEPGAAKFTLIHGRISQFENGPLIGHAWIVRPDGTTYDPVLDEPFPKWRDEQAIADHRYTRLQAARLSVTQGHSGPWT